MKKLLTITCRILLGATFLLSAYLKLFPIEQFELNFIDLGVANWLTAPFIARLLIGAEFFLGILLLLGIVLKKFTIPATLSMLGLFSVYLIIQLITIGNKGDCGCFGTYLQMTPLQSLIKNVILASLAILLYVLSEPAKIRFQKILITVFAVLALALPFMLNPIDLVAGKIRQPEVLNFPLPIALITGESTKNDTIDLMKGKHIVSFMSLTCPHCRAAAFKMHVMKKRHPEIPFYFILNGKEKNLQEFYDATKADNIDYMFLFGKNFYALTGGSLPTIYWVDNGVVVKKSLYISLNEDAILAWLNGD